MSNIKQEDFFLTNVYKNESKFPTRQISPKNTLINNIITNKVSTHDLHDIRYECFVTYDDLDSRKVGALKSVPQNASVTLGAQKLLLPLFDPIKWVPPAV